MWETAPEPTFSDLWYRTADLRPRISPHVRITRQHQGPEIAYIAEDPATSQYVRLSESAYFFLGMLDGRRTVDEAWEAACEQLGQHAPTQHECIRALASMQMFGLLIGDAPLAPDMIAERRARSRKSRLQRRTGNWMFYSIPVHNPDPWLSKVAPALRLIYSKWMLVIWCGLMAIALALVLNNVDRVFDGLNGVLRLDRNVFFMATIAFLLLRAIHELGHASACKAMGGRCTEIGLLLIGGILPLPYCDASSSWRFPETHKRVVVAAAGMMVEMFFAALATIVWATTSDAMVASFAYHVMLVASVTTILFNVNPLLRYDGYYMLSDLAGTPNLANRSRDLWKFLTERYLLGLKGIQPPRVRDAAEAWLMGVYGALSIPYRIFIGVMIIVVVSNQFLTVGIVLALVLFIMMLVVPVLKGIGYMVGSPKLVGRRARAFAIVGSILGGAGVLLGLVPAPASGYATGTVQPRTKSPVRVQEAGFVTQLLATPGSYVTKGQPLLQIENPDAATELAMTQARLERAEAELDAARRKSATEYERALRVHEQLSARVRRYQDRVASFTVVAAEDGRFISAEGQDRTLADSVGRYVTPGMLVGWVVTEDSVVVRAYVPDHNYAHIFSEHESLERASFRVRGSAAETHFGEIVRRVPAGEYSVAEESLTTINGGSVQTDPSDPRGKRTLESYFVVEIVPDDAGISVYPGQRARIRFALQPEPLGLQWWRTLHRYFGSRLGKPPVDAS